MTPDRPFRKVHRCMEHVCAGDSYFLAIESYARYRRAFAKAKTHYTGFCFLTCSMKMISTISYVAVVVYYDEVMKYSMVAVWRYIPI